MLQRDTDEGLVDGLPGRPVRRWLLDVTVLGAPVGAARPRVTQRGTFIPKNVRAWERRAVAAMSAWWLRARRGPLDCAVEVEVVAVHARPKRLMRRSDPVERIMAHRCKPDLDNVVKLALDALVKAGVIYDDTRVVQIAARKFYTALDEAPCVEVRVRAV